MFLISMLLGTTDAPEIMKLRAIHRRTSVNKGWSYKLAINGAEAYVAIKKITPKPKLNTKAVRL